MPRAGRLVALAALAFALLVARLDFLTDDAFISFRYARNLADGHGLVFNPGERVEGYTNLLWVLWLALGSRLGAPLEVLSRATSVACGLTLVLLVARVAVRRLGPGPVAPWASVLLVALAPPVATWSTGGLATLPFTLCVFGAFERLVVGAADGRAEVGRPRAGAAAAWAATAVLLRADGFVWAGLVGAAGLVASLGGARERRGERLRAALAYGAFVAAVVGAQFLWRHAYYGEWLPNTAKVKVGLSAELLRRGLEYVGSFFLTFPGLAVGIAAGAAVARRSELSRAALVLALGTPAYVALVGGDYMTMGRFLVPVVPFAALLLGAGLARVLGRGAAARTAGAALAVLCVAADVLPAFDLHATPRAWRAALHFRHPKPREYHSEHREWLGTTRVNARLRRLGRALALHTRPGESITQLAVGAVGYYAKDLVVLDQWGLTSAEVTAADVERREGKAGHDAQVPPTFFLHRDPTYFDALVVPRAEVDESALPTEKWGLPCAVDVIPLAPEDGFEPGLALLLFRWTAGS